MRATFGQAQLTLRASNTRSSINLGLDRTNALCSVRTMFGGRVKGRDWSCTEAISSVTSRSNRTIHRVPLPSRYPRLVWFSPDSGHVAASRRNDAMGQRRTLRKNPRRCKELLHLNSINAIAPTASWACTAVRTGKTTVFGNSYSKGAK